MIFFGTDGIRGEAYKSLPLIRSYQLGYALNEIFKERKVVIGYDTRESSLGSSGNPSLPSLPAGPC